MKTTIITALLLLATVTGAVAQEKWEYAVIHYTPYAREIQISINGIEFKKIDVPKEKIKGYADANAGFEELNKMTEQGWELFNALTNGSQSNIQMFDFYLRKKKQ